MLLLALVGCSSSDPSAPDAAVPADSAVFDVVSVDTGPVPCPALFPGEGNACNTLGECGFPDDTCGGKLTAACSAGVWKVTSKSTCQPFCPPQLPMAGTACQPAARTCFFWPRAMDPSCDSCTCTDGKWACTSPSTCPMTREQCKPGSVCPANTGCGAGRCNFFCACGADGVLHCSANPC